MKESNRKKGSWRPEATPRSPKISPSAERLVACAIIRDGITHHGQRSHYELRYSLEPGAAASEERRGDQSGFWTSKGRFVTRRQAVDIGIVSGQIPSSWATVRRDLLSSDIRW